MVQRPWVANGARLQLPVLSPSQLLRDAVTWNNFTHADALDDLPWLARTFFRTIHVVLAGEHRAEERLPRHPQACADHLVYQ